MKYTFKNVMILGLGCLLGFTSCSDSSIQTPRRLRGEM